MFWDHKDDPQYVGYWVKVKVKVTLLQFVNEKPTEEPTRGKKSRVKFNPN